MLNKITHEIYPKMSKQLEGLFSDGVGFGEPFVSHGLRIFAGELTGDGRIYSQYDYPLIIDNERVGFLREIIYREKPAVSLLKIDDENNHLSMNGKGFYAVHYFESNKTFTNNPYFAFL